MNIYRYLYIFTEEEISRDKLKRGMDSKIRKAWREMKAVYIENHP